jgi:hypothetical protein
MHSLNKYALSNARQITTSYKHIMEIQHKVPAKWFCTFFIERATMTLFITSTLNTTFVPASLRKRNRKCAQAESGVFYKNISYVNAQYLQEKIYTSYLLYSLYIHSIVSF